MSHSSGTVTGPWQLSLLAFCARRDFLPLSSGVEEAGRSLVEHSADLDVVGVFTTQVLCIPALNQVLRSRCSSWGSGCPGAVIK